MKQNNLQLRLLLIFLAVSPLVCYLEWGTDQSAFLYEIEYDLLFGSKASQGAFTHPFVFLPMLGQVLLLISAFLKRPSRRLAIFGIAGIGLLVLMVLLTGILGGNWKVIASTMPFLLASLIFLRWRFKKVTI